jgi:hypothetical protein
MLCVYGLGTHSKATHGMVVHWVKTLTDHLRTVNVLLLWGMWKYLVISGKGSTAFFQSLTINAVNFRKNANGWFCYLQSTFNGVNTRFIYAHLLCFVVHSKIFWTKCVEPVTRRILSTRPQVHTINWLLRRWIWFMLLSWWPMFNYKFYKKFGSTVYQNGSFERTFDPWYCTVLDIESVNWLDPRPCAVMKVSACV